MLCGTKWIWKLASPYSFIQKTNADAKYTADNLSGSAYFQVIFTFLLVATQLTDSWPPVWLSSIRLIPVG